VSERVCAIVCGVVLCVHEWVCFSARLYVFECVHVFVRALSWQCLTQGGQSNGSLLWVHYYECISMSALLWVRVEALISVNLALGIFISSNLLHPALLQISHTLAYTHAHTHTHTHTCTHTHIHLHTHTHIHLHTHTLSHTCHMSSPLCRYNMPSKVSCDYCKARFYPDRLKVRPLKGKKSQFTV